ncbi:MAG TPA: oxygen-independent coproporphyrinogen III oxidase [Rhodospirillaceae bacterium]|nr:oxygen-independent coproporphyrinogen III oxidase [Rhodospirillaceae bacterium]
MDNDLLSKYGGPVPRYTSYPTAPHFHDGIGGGTYAQWLRALRPAGGPVSLYLHVPFCRQLCTYCGCNTKITRQYGPVADYADLLAREIALVAREIPERLAVSHVHFGGGTPNILAPDDFVLLLQRLKRAFDISPETEIAVEVDPRHLTRDMVRAMASEGVNRVSMGVQDLNPEVQQAINRVQPLGVVSGAIEMLRDAGIDRINLDLMYGLPEQTMERLLRTVDLAADLGAQRIALFGYAHVPWMKTHQRLLEKFARAGAHGRFEQAEAAALRLAEHGYRRIGLDHFARPGDELLTAQAAGDLRRNFQGYTTDTAETVLAFGASSIGRLPQGFVQNAPDVGGYRRAVLADTPATVKGVALDDDDRLRGGIIEALMCDMAVDLDRFGGAAAYGAELARLHELAADGLVRIDGAKVSVPEAARPFMRVVAAQFDGYLHAPAGPKGGRHSMAV